MYRVRFTPEARRDLTRIPDKIRPAIFETIDGGIAVNPLRTGRPLGLDWKASTERRVGSTGSSIASTNKRKS